jgi:hypothetical protein
MRRPIRNRLYIIADLAIAFATLEALRLPDLPDAHGYHRPPDGAPHCTGPTACGETPRRRAQPTRARASRPAHR